MTIRSRLLLAATALGTAFALLHCASEDDAQSDAAPPDGATEDEATADGAIAVGPDASDASVVDALVDAPAAHCSPDHWCRTALPGKNISLVAVWSFGADDAIAVGSSGMIHWDGAAWSAVESDAGLESITSLWASGPDDVWAVAAGQHRLLHGTRLDGGALAWSSTETDGGPTRDLVTGKGSDLFIAGIHDDDGSPALEHSVVDDAGARVSTSIPVPPAATAITGLFAASTGELWLAAHTNPRAVVLRAKKTGANYVFTQSVAAVDADEYEFPALWGHASNEMWALGIAGRNYHRSPLVDGGGAWGTAPNDSLTALTGVWGSGAEDVYSVGYFGAIRHWDGAKWDISRIAVNGNPIFNHLMGIHGSSADDVWAVGQGIALHRTPTGGP